MMQHHTTTPLRAHRRRALYTCLLVAGAMLALQGCNKNDAPAADAAAQAAPVAAASDDGYPSVTDARLADAANDDGWLMYRRDYGSSGYAPFDSINATNVAGLKPAWDYKTAFDMGHESPPIVNGDYLFVTTPKNHLIAFQASTGKELWKYEHDLSNAGLKTVCCDVVNRGVALYEDKVYMATLDNHVVALDAKTGKVVWNEKIHEQDVGYAMTLAPLVVKGKVIAACPAANTARAATSRRWTPTPERKRGSSTPCRCLASRAATPGPRARPRPVAALPG